MKMTSFATVGLAAGFACCVSAVTLDVPRLSEPAFADRESSRDAALPEGRTDSLRVFRLEMTFEAGPSNNVQVAFGRDVLPEDGEMAAEETEFMVGWDRGAWFLRPQGLRERYESAATGTSGRRTLTASVRVRQDGTPVSAAFADGGAAFSFPGLVLDPLPAWLDPALWTHLRVTARGSGATNEVVSARFLPDGARVILR